MTEQLRNCHDCNAAPGQPHVSGCDTEQCSVCGEQRIGHEGCDSHDRLFARWTGLWPGAAEAAMLSVDLNEFHRLNYPQVFFIKPNL